MKYLAQAQILKLNIYHRNLPQTNIVFLRFVNSNTFTFRYKFYCEYCDARKKIKTLKYTQDDITFHVSLPHGRLVL